REDDLADTADRYPARRGSEGTPARERATFNRPTIARAVNETSSAVELTEFEQVDAAPGRALLRVAARPSAGFAGTISPILLITAGDQVHRLTPLPAPPDPSVL